MRPSEIIKYVATHDTSDAGKVKLCEIIDAMAEDIEELKRRMDCPFPMFITPLKKREWEK